MSRSGRTGPGVGVLRSILTTAAVVALICAATSFSSTVAPAGAQSQGDDRTSAGLRLLEQSVWVEPNGAFSVSVAAPADVAAGSVLRAHLHDRVSDRDELQASSFGALPPELARIDVAIDTTTEPDGDGDVDRYRLVELTLPLTDASVDERPNRYRLTEEGLYPVVLEIVENPTRTEPAPAEPDVSETEVGETEAAETEDRETSDTSDTSEVSGNTPTAPAPAGDERVTDTLITHLVRLPGANASLDDGAVRRPLGVSLIVDIHEPLTIDADGTPQTDAEDRERTEELVDALASYPTVAATIRPTPRVVDQLASAGTNRAQQLLDQLRLATADREVLATPYTRLDPSAWINAELDEELAARLALGTETLTRVLGGRPDRRIVIHDGKIPPALLSDLRALGVDAFVVDDAHLDLLNRANLNETLLRKFQLAEAARGTSVALAADSDLSAHLEIEDQTLAAHRVLSDLAFLAMEDPTASRAAVVRPAEAFTGVAMQTLLPGLRNHPLLRPSTLDRLFDQAELARGPDVAGSEGEVLRRRLRPNPVSSIAGYPEALAGAQAQLEAFQAMVGVDSVRPEPWEQFIRMSASEELALPVRIEMLNQVENQIRAQTRGIDVPSSQSVTLTTREGEIPIRLRNSLGYPVQVRIELESDKLEIAEADRARVVELEEGSNPIEIPVATRTSGDSRLLVRITSPDGHLDLGEGNYTIRSTSVSGFGIALSIGAGIVLLIWWIRHHRDRRRDRRLVAAEL